MAPKTAADLAGLWESARDKIGNRLPQQVAFAIRDRTADFAAISAMARPR